jgi:long-chain acyl-CoA synthetase
VSETLSSRPLRADLDTIPKILLRNARELGDKPAYREKDLGIWQTWTWSETLDEVRAFSIGLAKLGLERGQAIAIIGDNRPRLYWAFTAAQALGAIPVPVYQDSVAEETLYVLQHAEVVMAIVEDQEQVDKLLSISEQLATIRQVVYEDPRGLLKYDHTRLHSIEAVQKIGRDELERDPSAAQQWLDEIAKGNGGDPSVILYTSGTTGRPKGVVLSGDNLIITARNANEFDDLKSSDEIIAYLPMAWVGDHIFSYAQAYVAGFCVACPESPATATQDQREVGPTFFFAPPRRFEAQLTDILVRMEDASRLKKWLFDYFLGVAKRCGERILEGKPVGFLDRLLYKIGDIVIYGPLRNRLGLSRLRVGYTAGEAIGPEIFSFYRSLGINLKQLLGQTEASVYITMQPDGEIYPDTVGKPAPGVEVKIADNGEILYRSPGVFLSYFKNDEATAATKTADGWVHSGDAGFFDSRNHLVIIDRAKDVGKLTDGSLFAPKYIENKIKFFPEIREAVAIGDGQDYVALMVNIDLESVGNWAERNNVIYASYQELAAHPDVYKMIEKRVDETNRSLSREPRMAGAQIKRFLVLHKELDADDGELTRTQKVRRSFIAERYAPLIAALYDGSKDCHIKTEVTFEDGRKGNIEGHVKIIDMETYPVAKSAQLEAAE